MTSETLNVKVGHAYFLCGYYLRNAPIPEIETWIYIGANVLKDDRPEDQTYHYFKRPEVYFEKEIEEEYSKYKLDGEDELAQQVEENPLIRVSEEDLDGLVYDYRKLCDWVAALGKEPNAEKYL